MDRIMQELSSLAKARPVELKKAKESGKKIVQYTGNFIPAAMINAVGAEPYLMCRGGDPEPPDAILEYMIRFMNPLARSMGGYYLMGLDPVTPICDLIVAQQTDNHVGRVTEFFEYKGLPVHKVGVPPDWKKRIAFDYYLKSLKKLQLRLEELTGNAMDINVFKEYLGYTNQISASLRKIDDLRKKDNPPIGESEFIRLNHYVFAIDPKIMCGKLEELYNMLKDKPGKFTDNAPRILFAGHALAIGDYVVPKIVEESGAVIVAEMLDEGIWAYKNNISLEGDLLENFAKSRYLDKVPTNIFQPAWEERYQNMKKDIAKYKVDGVIWYQLSFDEIYDMEYSCLAKWLANDKVPLIKMETSYEYSREAMAPLITRIESFVKTLKEGE